MMKMQRAVMTTLCLQLVCAGCGSGEFEADTPLHPGPCVVERASAGGSIISRTEYTYGDRDDVMRVESKNYALD